MASLAESLVLSEHGDKRARVGFGEPGWGVMAAPCTPIFYFKKRIRIFLPACLVRLQCSANLKKIKLTMHSSCGDTRELCCHSAAFEGAQHTLQ